MKTRITEMLGIKYPLLQGGMAWVAEPPLAAAVSNAGGLGIITGSYYPPDQWAEKVRETKRLTSRPFGVNFTPGCQYLKENLEVCLRAEVPVVTYGRGRHTTDSVIDQVKPHGMLCFPVVGTVRQAERVEAEGADAVIISGTEGGGHTGRISSLVLLALAAQRVKIPIIAAGGFGDGRGVAAALTLGAQGVQMGTRFVCTQECPAHPAIKQMLLQASEEDTVVTGHVTGIRMRCLKNQLTQLFEDMEGRRVGAGEFDRAGIGKIRAAFVDGDCQGGSVACGQVVGLVGDMPTCQELIERIMAEARHALESARTLFTD